MNIRDLNIDQNNHDYHFGHKRAALTSGTLIGSPLSTSVNVKACGLI